MIRELDRLGSETFDVLVIGAGIHGACAAREAALRGLSVALIDRGDFGCATSHNSLKIAHGGLRYLQHLDFPRVRQSVSERRFWLRQAPHLVRPIPFMMPLHGLATRGPAALYAAMRMHEMVGFDRNKGVPENRQIPKGRLISARTLRNKHPSLDSKDCTGGAIWYDGQMQDTDALLRSCIRASVDHGGIAANYVRATNIKFSADKLQGVEAVDQLSGEGIFIACRQILNASGPWIGQFLQDALEQPEPIRLQCLKNMNLVVRRPPLELALGVTSRRRSDAAVGESSRLYFMTPWRGHSIIGTTHFPYDGDADNCRFELAEIEDFLAEFNEAYPVAKLSLEDVSYCYGGLTPAEESVGSDSAQRSRHSEIIDHRLRDSVDGLFSIVGVKYTTARLLAEWAVDAAMTQRGMELKGPRSRDIPLPGATGFDEEAMERQLTEITSGTVDKMESRYFLETHGAEFREALQIGEWTESDGDHNLFRCRTRYSVRREMAVRLSDILVRRTDLGARGRLTQADIDWATDFMAKELNWTPERKIEELANASDEMTKSWLRLADNVRSSEVASGASS